ncbi:MAG: hypothetical protein RLZ83_947, partial [Pseudomonadota bacterium]
MKHRPWRWAVPLSVIVVLVLLAVFADLVAPYDPNAQNLLGRLKPPGTQSRAWFY